MKVLLIGVNNNSTKILYNSLTLKYTVENVLIENSESKARFFRRRIRKLGLLKVLDQFLFMTFLSKILQIIARNRIDEIKMQNNLSDRNIPKELVKNVDSVNSLESIDFIKSVSYDIVLINGTRIISEHVISTCKALIINLHAGITPNYRGVHGAYWAIFDKKDNLAGVTLHKVDSGVDTGEVIDQKLISVSKQDNYATYPILQLVVGLELIKNYLECIENYRIVNGNFYGNKKESKQWYHPGFFEYCYNFLSKGVK
jgi:folate-dependent phosphoribosylglycinamide formyltransferase PurN